MKKSLLTFAMVACSVFAVNAQMVKGVPATVKKNVAKKETMFLTESLGRKMTTIGSAKTVTNFKNAKKAAVNAQSNLEAFYAVPSGAWFEGVEPGQGWYNIPYIYTPALVDQVYENLTQSSDTQTPITYEWTSQYGKVSSDAEANGVASCWGMIDTPKLIATQGANTSEYVIGSQSQAGFGVWNGGTQDDYVNLGMAQFGNGTGPYGGFSNLELKTNTKADMGGGTTYFDSNIVGFAEYFNAPNDYTSAKSAIITLSADDNSSATPLNGKTLTCKIYKIEEDGSLGDVIMTATAKDENVTPLSDWLYSIEFPFTEEDPLFGTVESTVVIDSDVLVVFEGFENVSTSFGGPFCATEGTICNGYVLLEDGTISTVAYRGTNYPQIDFLVTLSAVMPTLTPYSDMPEEIVIPKTGGYGVTVVEDGEAYNDYILMTSTMDTELFYIYSDLENPEDDWVTVEADDEQLESGFLSLFFKADALPEGIESRSCVMTIDLFGKTVDVIVKQGDSTDAIQTVTSTPKKSSVVYNTIGQRVNDNAKGIVIKNGKRLIR